MGLEASMVKSPAAATTLVQAFVSPANKKMSEQMELDKVVSQFYHAFSKVNKFFFLTQF